MKSNLWNFSQAKKLLYIIIISILFQSQAQLLSATPPDDGLSLSGYIIDKQSKETLIGATVFIKDTKLGAYTNRSGYFSIGNIPEGEFAVVISSIGYARLEQKLTFKSNKNIRRTFEMTVSSIMTGGVSVEAEREADKRQISISRVNVPMKQIKEIRIGGESDVFRSLQYLPGVLTSSQISSGLYIRGGSPDQNLVLLDGTAVYNPSHLFGFISTFNSDAIKDVDLIKGGFPAEYGNRLSAVLNLTQKNGNREEFEGIGKIGFISSHIGVEGPLGNGSFYVGGRRTYFELLKGLMEEDPKTPFPDFSFYDINAKVTQDFGDNDKMFLSFFNSADNLDMSTYGMSLGLDIGNRLGAIKWTHIFADNLFSTVNFSSSYYFNNFLGDMSGYEFLIDNSITDFTLKSSLEWFNSEKLTTKFGFESIRFSFEYVQDFTGDRQQQDVDTSSGGVLNLNIIDYNHSVYSQVNYMFDDLTSIQAGIRANYWTLSQYFSLDPRLAIRYQLQEDIAVKLAWGIYHQSLRLATLPDFTFFDTWIATDQTVPESRSDHYILSIESKVDDGIDLNFDVYYKKFWGVNELIRTAVEGDNTADMFYIGDANAYGVEVFLQKNIGRFTGWLGYALGFIYAKFDSVNRGEEFHPKYDRTHDFKAVAQYELDDTWNFGAVFVFQTGQSYTGATSIQRTAMPFQNRGKINIFPSQRYGLRLPPSHQLNVYASYAFESFGLDSRLILDIYNIYNRRDIWFRYYNTRGATTVVEDVRLLPIIPTLSYEIKF